MSDDDNQDENQNYQEIAENEWSHFFDVDELEDKPIVLTLSPDDAERQRLAQRLNLVTLVSLVADLEIKKEAGGMTVHIIGKLKAELVQSCVVTLEDVKASVEDKFEAWYADQGAAVSLARAKHERASKHGQSEVRMLEEEDDPESIVDGKIDLGELVTQYLSLAIDPYPHAKGVERAGEGKKDVQYGDKDVANPFAALKDWKHKLPDDE